MYTTVKYTSIDKQNIVKHTHVYIRLTSNPQIHVRFLHVSPRHLYFRSMSFFQLLKSVSNSQIGVKFSNLWPFLTFSNRHPMMYGLTLTKISAIDLRIWKGPGFEDTLKPDRDLR